tara:strand:- start:456 stop:707 length:252 start_codon:yes stop_codon:yes gene_type:complete
MPRLGYKFSAQARKNISDGQKLRHAKRRATEALAHKAAVESFADEVVDAPAHAPELRFTMLLADVFKGISTPDLLAELGRRAA